MDYRATITTSASPLAAARAIGRDLEIWWSTRVDRQQDGFTVRFNNSHATFRKNSDDTDLSFRWTCIDANMIMEGVEDAGEWIGTQLVWSIQPAQSGSAITLVHSGLTPQIACFEICRSGWRHFFETSLCNHLNGQPAQPETSLGVHATE